MKKIIILSVFMLLISSCVNSSICGTYVFNKSTLILQEDNTYLYTPSDSGLTQKGTFSQNGNEIQLTSAFGTSTILKITAGGLIDDENSLWRKIWSVSESPYPVLSGVGK
jgi:hypothetical protein